MAQDKRRFQRGSGVYVCRRCETQTRDTGTGEGQFGLCAACYEIESYENEHNDDGHDGDIKDCLECRRHLSRKALSKLDETKPSTKKSIKRKGSPSKDSTGHKYHMGSYVFCRLFADEGDSEWLHCIVVGLTSVKGKPTYTVRKFGDTFMKTNVPENKLLPT